MILTSDPKKIEIVWRVVYWIKAAVLNLAISYFLIFLAILAQTKPDSRLSFVAGLIIGELSYRISPILNKYRVFYKRGDVDTTRDFLLFTLTLIFNIVYVFYVRVNS